MVLVEQVVQRRSLVDLVDLGVVEQEKVQEQVVLVVQLVLLVKVVPVELDMEAHQAVVVEVAELPLPEEMLVLRQVVEQEVQEHQIIF
jgi:hypothetical protein